MPLTVKAFAADLKVPGGESTTQIERVCADLSPAFIKSRQGAPEL